MIQYKSKECVKMKKIISLMIAAFMITSFTACKTLEKGLQAANSSIVAESNISAPKEYSIKMNIKCSQNLIFSKYDVMVYVDDIELDKIDHGSERSFDLSLTAGNHVIRFANVKNDSVDGTTDLEVNNDMEISYKISCNSDQVEISMTAKKEKLEEGQCAVPGSSKDFKAEQYTEVVKQLKKAGFTNIKTEKIEDLITGILTSDGEVESVTIDGNDDYIEGTAFSQDAEIIVKYHTFPEKSKNESNSQKNDNSKSLESSENSELSKERDIPQKALEEEDSIKAEESRRAEASKKAEESRRVETSKKAEESKRAEASKKAEESRRAEASKKAAESEVYEFEFILNTKTNVLHTRNCSAAAQMKDENKKIITVRAHSRIEAIQYMSSQGYNICNLC